MTQPITLYLIGFAGSGKYTVAKEIAKFEYRIVDNQLINNPIFSLLDLDGVAPIPEKAWASIEDIRKAILGFVFQDPKSNYVFTNELYEVDHDRVIYNQVKRAAEKRGSLFVPVKLRVSLEERKRRITNPERLDRFKTTNLGETQTQQELIKIDHPHLLEIEVTGLSAGETAKEILDFVEHLESTFPKAKEKHSTDEIILDETDSSEIREALWQGVKAFNQPYTGNIITQPFSLSIRDESSKVVAGIYGFTFLDHARVEYTWVNESYRKQGLGRKLFQKLDEYCRSKGCSVIQLDTFDFQAPSFYEKIGFEYIGTVFEWSCGYDCYFMRKKL
jgi:GNAT superfamily N-acetyltransferase